MVSENISESLLHQMCSRVTSCDLMSSDGVYLQSYSVALFNIHCEACIFRIDNMQENAVFFYYTHNPQNIITVFYDACIVYLTAACSIEWR